MCACMVLHPHYPSPRTKLASLVKGEVLSPERIRATTGGIAFLPHPFRFSDTFVNNPSIVGSASHCNRSSHLHKGAKGDSALPTLPNPHYPSKIANTLASLVKGRWLDGKAQTVALLRPACDMSVLFILQTFLPSRRRDCLSCIDPLHPHNHCKKTIVPCSALNLPPLSKVRCCRPKEFGRLPEGLLSYRTLSVSQAPPLTIPQ